LRETEEGNEAMSKSIAEQYAGRCIHFTGIQHEECGAGVNYRALVGGPDFGWATRLPCLKGNTDAPPCALCHFPTPEETQTHVDEFEANMQRQQEDMEIVGAAHKNPAHQGLSGQSFVYVCELCERASRFVSTTALQASVHLQESHGVPEAEIKAARGERAAHLDATDWFQNDDRFTLPDGRAFLLRSIRTPRRGMGKAMWADMAPKKRRRGRERGR
jgi:hypothetical protein